MAAQSDCEEVADEQPKRAGSRRRLRGAAVGSLVVGIAPLIANWGSDAAATALGCYIAEYDIYERSGTWSDFSDDVPGCRLGATDIGSFLVALHTSGLAIVLTLPFVFVSAWLWTLILVRRLRRSRP